MYISELNLATRLVFYYSRAHLQQIIHKGWSMRAIVKEAKENMIRFKAVCDVFYLSTPDYKQIIGSIYRHYGNNETTHSRRVAIQVICNMLMREDA